MSVSGPPSHSMSGVRLLGVTEEVHLRLVGAQQCTLVGELAVLVAIVLANQLRGVLDCLQLSRGECLRVG